MAKVRAFASLLAAALVGIPGAAFAQSAPTAAATDLGATLDTGPHGPLPLQLAALTLTSPSFLPGQRVVPGCDAEAETTGNSEGPAGTTGLPLIGSIPLRLSPRLAMLSFSRLGCPITAGLGMAFTYEIPIRRALSLSLGASLYAQPQALDRGLARRELLRGDLAWKRPDGEVTQTLGVQALRVHGTSGTTTVSAAYGLHF
jgi:hypothetical protein